MWCVGEAFVRMRIGKEYQQETVGRRHGIFTWNHQWTRSAVTTCSRWWPERRFGCRVECINKCSGKSSHRTLKGNLQLVYPLFLHIMTYKVLILAIPYLLYSCICPNIFFFKLFWQLDFMEHINIQSMT